MAYNEKKGPPPGFTGLITKVRETDVVGGAAGALTLTGIRKNKDYIVSVRGKKLTLTEGTPNTYVWVVADFTSEFSISADNTIDNTGGTATTGYVLSVAWYQNDLGEQSNPVRS